MHVVLVPGLLEATESGGRDAEELESEAAAASLEAAAHPEADAGSVRLKTSDEWNDDDDGNDEDDDDDDGSDDDDEPHPGLRKCVPSSLCSAAGAQWLYQRPVSSVVAALGILLVGIGYELISRTAESARTSALALLLVGCWLVAGLVADAIVDVCTWLLGVLLNLTNWWHLRSWCSTIVVVVGETRAWLVRLVWAALALVGTMVVIPEEESSAWAKARYHLARLLAIALMVSFARVATTLVRMRLLADFSSPALQGRIFKTMQHEFVLGALAGSTWNAIFMDMFGLGDFTASSTAVGTAVELGAKQWQDLFLYVGSHSADGSALSSTALRRRRPGSRRRTLAAANETGYRTVGKRLWRRTLVICTAHRRWRLASATTRATLEPAKSGDETRDQDEALEREPEERDLEERKPKDMEERLQQRQIETMPELVEQSKDRDMDKGEARKNVVGRAINSSKGTGSSSSMYRVPPLSLSTRASLRSKSPGPAQVSRRESAVKIRPKIYLEDMAVLFRNLERSLFFERSGELVDIRGLEMARILGELFDAGNARYVTQQRFVQAIVGVFNDRTNMSVTLLDSRRVLASIDTFAFAFALIVVFFVSLTMYNIDFLAVWITLSSVVLGFAFIFGKTLQVAFENTIFLFAHRPYEVGDHIGFPPEYNRYVVSRINLFTTEMRRWDGQGAHFDNSRLLALQPLFNLSTSTGRALTPGFLIDAECCTPTFVRAVESELRDYVNARKQTFVEECDFIIETFSDPFKMRCAFYAHLTDNITVDVMKSRRDLSDFNVACCEILQRHGARYSRAYDRPYAAPYDPPRVAHHPPKGIGVEVAHAAVNNHLHAAEASHDL